MNPIFELTKSILKSRLGRIFFAAHFILAACAFALHLASRPVPAGLSDEPFLFQAVYWLNIPTIFVTAWIASPVLYKRRYEDYGIPQWLGVGFVVLCVLAQWWLIGYIIERLLAWGDRVEP
ncbi:MAG: hypothetical protein LC754_06460 [Acidobacteria bacterium]|nr:hypothetical protein [Acidobacteriota bacterium]